MCGSSSRTDSELFCGRWQARGREKAALCPLHTAFERVRLDEPHVLPVCCVLTLRECEARRAAQINYNKML